MSKSDICKEEFIRVGTTLYKLVNQPRLNGGYVKKRIVWNNETLRQDYGKHFLATVPKYDGFCTVPDHVNYRPVVDKFLKYGRFRTLQAHSPFCEQNFRCKILCTSFHPFYL